MLTGSQTDPPSIYLPTNTVVVTEGQSTIFVMCRTNPRNVVTRWTLNGKDVSTDTTGTLVVRGRYNHTLSIHSPTLENIGTYACHGVDTHANASFNLIVKPGTYVNMCADRMQHIKF